ncbi:uncharacterized protein SCODWIG_02381 [Saccharomycodes ludwigii]|uniref:Arrestin C-terminal-like domain-containing protein n=1 Tax=Saccharomycodes ludwigii TaxID=36035 RepID=A0A376B917_9ASCO|nr:uncharacterized protein SCODWIG_02381 [Saccharomycodes ludwigii]
MLSFTTPKGSSKPPVLFDIRLNNADHDVLVFTGSPQESPSVLLSGTIVLSITEPMYVKSMSLRLYGMLRVRIPVTYNTANGGSITRINKYDKRFYEHSWKDVTSLYDTATTNNTNRLSRSSSSSSVNLNSNNNNQININDNNNNNTNSSSSSGSEPLLIRSASGLFKKHIKPKSSTNLKNLTSSAGAASSMARNNSNNNTQPIDFNNNNVASIPPQLLEKGNYEFPFSTILPGTTIESVEGLPHGSIVYKLQASIQRSKFLNDITVKKHIRIIRTLSPDSVDLSETVAVDNTWPNKVEYTISTPAKSVIIGSSIPISLIMVPLLKGLKLGPIKIQLVEYCALCGPYGPPYTEERIVTKLKVSDPLGHRLNYDDDGLIFNDFQDRWDVDLLLNIPPSLSKGTQDCTILNNIKVRHKLKFTISLINPDGHMSELRASLPIQLFISPFVQLGVKSASALDGGNSSGEGSIANTISNRSSSTNLKSAVGGSDFSRNNKNSSFINPKGPSASEDIDDDFIFGSTFSAPSFLNTQYANNLNSVSNLSTLLPPPGITPDINNVHNNVSSNGDTNNNSSSLNVSMNNNTDTVGRLESSGSQVLSSVLLNSLMAPPNYENRIYDRLWSDINYEESPVQSGTQTPISQDHNGAASDGTVNNSNDNPLNDADNVDLLQMGLEQLQLEREGQNDNINDSANASNLFPAPPVISITASEPLQNPALQHLRNLSALSTTDIPSVRHLSRANSFAAPNSSSINSSVPNIEDPDVRRSNSFEWEVKNLSKVPTYDNALKTPTLFSDDLPPAYPSHEDNHIFSTATIGSLELPKLLYSRSSRSDLLDLSILNSSDNNGTNNNATANGSRHGSVGGIAGARNNMLLSKSPSKNDFSDTEAGIVIGKLRNKPNNTVTKQFGFGMTPINHSNSNNSSGSNQQNNNSHLSNNIDNVPGNDVHGLAYFTQQEPFVKPKSSAPLSKSRSGSFVGLIGLLKK